MTESLGARCRQCLVIAGAATVGFQLAGKSTRDAPFRSTLGVDGLRHGKPSLAGWGVWAYADRWPRCVGLMR